MIFHFWTELDHLSRQSRQIFKLDRPSNPSYPGVSVKASVYLGDISGDGLDNTANFAPVAVQSLDTLLEDYFNEGAVTNTLIDPATNDVFGVGEVWVDTQFEKTDGKSKPGTATAIDTTIWEVSKKVALEMNNPHNMWVDKDQTVIYQTEWFDNKLTTFDRESGEWISTVEVGESPSHVMTRTDTDDIHVALNGEEGVAEILATTEPEEVERIIAMQGLGQAPTHPHAHWMISDGQKMVTPNAFTHDTTLYGFDDEEIIAKTPTGVLAIPNAYNGWVQNLPDEWTERLTCEQRTPIDLEALEACNDEAEDDE